MSLIETAKDTLKNADTQKKTAFVISINDVRKIIRILHETYPGRKILENPIYTRQKEAWDAHLAILLFLEHAEQGQIFRLKKLENPNIRKEDANYLRKQFEKINEHAETIIDCIEKLQEGYEKNKQPWLTLEEHKNAFFEWISF